MSTAGDNRLPVLATEIAQAHAACRRSSQEAIQRAVEAGRLLTEAKRLVRHGEWVQWLQANVPAITPRTAQRYMVAAERSGENDAVSFFRLRDLIKPSRERFGWADERRIVILSPSAYPGFTHVTVVDAETWEASGFVRPVRDDVIQELVTGFLGCPWPEHWVSRRRHGDMTNPWLKGAELEVSNPDHRAQLGELVRAADSTLDALGYTGPRDVFLGAPA